ncbi:ubiquinol oxidase subunit II [Thiotrichales bacterium 19S9-12]|nr:ubiquinol oxidase subunit II [Thiotrichales bacterium 19S9-11]MCF6811802.1 ubiquinol oxidase subunit II [Thiotrichales bacterium 19S9-12]
MIKQLIMRASCQETHKQRFTPKILANSLKLITLTLSFILLSGCSSIISMHPKGLVAAEEKELFIIATLLMLIVVIPVIVLTLLIAWRYRASNTKATYKPNWAHSTILEVVWWTIPIIIIAILAVITWITTHKLDPYRTLDTKDKNKPLVVQVVALDWKWLFIYPEQNIATVNYLQIPTHRQVEFKITADAPMSSFIIPQIGGQIYAMAGMQTRLHLIAEHPGIYSGFNANYTGKGFAGMKFNAKATSQAQFDQWVSKVKRANNRLTHQAYMQLAKPTIDAPVTYYSSVMPKLYHDIMMKFMMPSSRMIEKAPKKEEIRLIENGKHSVGNHHA